MNFLENYSTSISEERLNASLKSRFNNGYTQDEIDSVTKINSRIFTKDLNITEDQISYLKNAISHYEISLLRPNNITSHRKYFGKVIVFFKKIFFRIIGFCIKDTFRHQSEFNATMIELYVKSLKHTK